MTLHRRNENLVVSPDRCISSNQEKLNMCSSLGGGGRGAGLSDPVLVISSLDTASLIRACSFQMACVITAPQPAASGHVASS